MSGSQPLASPATSAAASTRSACSTQSADIVGTWKFLGYVRTDPVTGKNKSVFGEHPRGWLVYTAEGRMMVIVVPERRKPLEKDEDRIAHHKEMIAYTGRYTVDADKVIHHVDVAWNEAWIGLDLVRSYKIGGEILTITTAPTKYDIHGVEHVSTLTLQRVRPTIVC